MHVCFKTCVKVCCTTMSPRKSYQVMVSLRNHSEIVHWYVLPMEVSTKLSPVYDLATKVKSMAYDFLAKLHPRCILAEGMAWLIHCSASLRDTMNRLNHRRSH